MKKILSILLSTVLLFSVMSLPTAASTIKTTQVTPTVEYLEDGSYFITEIETTSNPLLRSSTGGSKTATYYNSYGSAIYAVTVYGNFYYSYGSTAYATSASSSLSIYSSDASYNSKSSSYSSNIAYG